MNETIITMRQEISELRYKVDEIIKALALFADVSIPEAWDIVNNYYKQGKI